MKLGLPPSPLNNNPGQLSQVKRRALGISRSQAGFLAVVTIIGMVSGNFGYNAVFQAQKAPTSQVQQVRVARGSVRGLVSTTGQVQANAVSNLTFIAASGDARGRVAELYVAEGDVVKTGQPLAKLDTTQLEYQLAQAQNSLDSAQARLDAQLAGSRAEDISSAEASVASAQQRLANMLAGSKPEEIQAARASLASAQSRLNELRAGATPLDLQTAQSAVDSARSSLQTAEARLKQLKEGPTQSDLLSAQGAVESAKASLQNAQAKLKELKDGPTAADLQASQTSVENARTSLQTAEARLRQLKEGPTAVELLTAQATVDKAKATLANAEVALQELKNGPTPAELASAQASVESSRTSLLNAETTLANLMKGLDEKIITNILALYDAYKEAEAKLRADIAANAPPAQIAEDTRLVQTKLAALKAAENELSIMRPNVTYDQLKAARAAADSARSSLKSAEAKLKELQDGPTNAELLSAQSAVDNAKAALTTAQATLKQLKDGPTAYDLTSAQGAVDSARSSLKSAEAKFEQLKAGASESDLASAQSSIDLAQASIKTSEAKLAQLIAGATQADLIAAQSSVDSAQANLKNAQAKLADLQAGAKPADLASGEASVASAISSLTTKENPYTEIDVAIQQASITQAQNSLSKVLTPYNEYDIRVTKASVEQARINLEIAKENLQYATLVAPNDGVITAVNIQVGVTAGGGQTVFQLVDVSKMKIDGFIDEVDVAKLKLGQPVDVTFEGLPGKSYKAEITYIALNATTTSGVTSYKVSMELKNKEDVRLGMTANADIIVEQRDNVLLVPNRAIATSGRNRTVQVLVNEKPQARVVQLGLSDGQNTEITRGLQEGDTVQVATATKAAQPRLPGGMGGGAIGIPIGRGG